MPLIKVSNLSVDYTQKRALPWQNDAAEHAVKQVSFDINEGEIFGLIGESGCGKTTVAKALSGLVPYSGNIEFQGADIKGLNFKERSKLIQMVFQNPYASLNPMMTISQILEEPLKIHKLFSAQKRKELVSEMFDKIKLSKQYKNSYPKELSGGERQRVAIGCALMLSPKLIIADEILTALDAPIQAHILAMLTNVIKEAGLTMLFISHDINAVAHFCNRVAVMHDGQILEIASADELYNNPKEPYTKSLIAMTPTIKHKIALG